MREWNTDGRGDRPPTPFKSALERVVADELDSHSVQWVYELPPKLPAGKKVYYLPDFTIRESPPDLMLPFWLEVKPQQMLYDLRDDLGVTRRHGDKFSGEIVIENVWWENIAELRSIELAKPKKLAEITGASVLVIGGVGGVSRLSIEMRPEEIIFSRSHPFPNWRAVLVKREREAQRLAFEREQSQRAERWRESQQTRMREEMQRRACFLSSVLSHASIGVNRFLGTCPGCNCRVESGRGSLYRHGGAFVVICDRCVRSGGNLS